VRRWSWGVPRFERYCTAARADTGECSTCLRFRRPARVVGLIRGKARLYMLMKIQKNPTNRGCARFEPPKNAGRRDGGRSRPGSRQVAGTPGTGRVLATVPATQALSLRSLQNRRITKVLAEPCDDERGASQDVAVARWRVLRVVDAASLFSSRILPTFSTFCREDLGFTCQV
jgi:hypothetical protein